MPRFSLAPNAATAAFAAFPNCLTTATGVRVRPRLSLAPAGVMVNFFAAGVVTLGLKIPLVADLEDGFFVFGLKIPLVVEVVTPRLSLEVALVKANPCFDDEVNPGLSLSLEVALAVAKPGLSLEVDLVMPFTGVMVRLDLSLGPAGVRVMPDLPLGLAGLTVMPDLSLGPVGVVVKPDLAVLLAGVFVASCLT
jgi:hypothetical protein